MPLAVFELQDDDQNVRDTAAMFVAYYGDEKQRVAAVPTLNTIIETRVGKPEADLPRVNALNHLSRCGEERTKVLIRLTVK